MMQTPIVLVARNRSRMSEFYKITKDKPPSPLLKKAVSLLGGKGHALDLGCGAGRDTRFLLEQGFTVVAVDKELRAGEMLKEFAHKNLRFVSDSFENFAFEKYDLVTAQWSLPFVAMKMFDKVFARVKNSLEPRGIFAGQFFGVNDEWNTPGRRMTFHAKDQLRGLLRGMKTLEFREEEIDGNLADGTPKHWHVFHVIARKPLTRP